MNHVSVGLISGEVKRWKDCLSKYQKSRSNNEVLYKICRSVAGRMIGYVRSY